MMATHGLELSSGRSCRVYGRHHLERFDAGELGLEDRKAIECHIVSCNECKELLNELKVKEEEFKARLPFTRFAAELEARGARQQTLSLWDRLRLWWPAPLAAGLLAAAALVIFVVPRPGTDSGTRVKGAPAQLSFLVRDKDSVHPGGHGEQLREGDRIQFLVRPATDSRAMVLVGVDGKGDVTVYEAIDYRTRPKGDAALAPLPRSIVLDDSVGPERFFAVFSSRTDARELSEIVRQAAHQVAGTGDLVVIDRLELDVTYPQTSVMIRKVAP